MHPAGRLPQVVKSQIRPVFTEAVRENPVGRLAAAQIDNWLTDGLHTANGLHSRFSARAVVHFYLDGAIRALFVELKHINKIGFVVQSAASDRHLLTGAEIIFEGGLRNLMPRVIVRA